MSSNWPKIYRKLIDFQRRMHHFASKLYIGAKADRPRQSTVDTRKSRTTLDKWIDNGEGFNSREVSGSGKRWAW